MLLTDDADLAERVRSMRNQGRDADGTWMRHLQLGFNYRIDELSAALGVAQVERLAELRAGRDRVVADYAQAFAGRPWVTLPAVTSGASVDWFVYVMRLDSDIDRDRLILQLQELGNRLAALLLADPPSAVVRREVRVPARQLPSHRTRRGRTLALPFSSLMSRGSVAQVVAAMDDSVAEQGHA